LEAGYSFASSVAANFKKHPRIAVDAYAVTISTGMCSDSWLQLSHNVKAASEKI